MKVLSAVHSHPSYTGHVHGGFLILYGSRLLNVAEFFKGMLYDSCECAHVCLPQTRPNIGSDTYKLDSTD